MPGAACGNSVNHLIFLVDQPGQIGAMGISTTKIIRDIPTAMAKEFGNGPFSAA